MNRIADVLPQAGKIGEAKIKYFCAVFGTEFYGSFWIHALSFLNSRIGTTDVEVPARNLGR
jgi:hypothetical protein